MSLLKVSVSFEPELVFVNNHYNPKPFLRYNKWKNPFAKIYNCPTTKIISSVQGKKKKSTR